MGIVLTVVILMKLFGTKHDPIDYEDSFGEVNYSNIEGKVKGEEDLTFDFSINEDNDTDDYVLDEAPNYLDVYMDKHGVIATEEAIETVKKAMRLWLEENNERTMWEDYATSSFFDSYSSSFSPSLDGLVRIIQGLEVHAAEPINDSEMRFSVYATWNLSDGELTINQQSKLYYVTLVPSETKFLVNEVDEL